MEIKEIKDKQVWEDFLLRCEEKTFLQSWPWGEFQKMLQNKIWRLGVFDKSDLLAVALTVKISAKRGKFLFVPHGPSVALAKEGGPTTKIQNRVPAKTGVKVKILENLLVELKKIAEEENCGFIRIAALWLRTEENKKIFKDLGFREAPLHTHPELTWQLDITPPEEKLLLDMRKTTRYLVKQGLKARDLKIEKSQEPKDLAIFNALYQKTAGRHHFVPFSYQYLKNELSAFLPGNNALIFSAKYKGECLASAIIIFWQGTAFYHQGASVQKYSKIPASYLLQWEAIKEAKRMGCKTYNFWGIAPIIENLKKHPWYGLTLFKMGFGGYKKEYVRTQDLPLSPFYWLTFLFEKLRQKRRGF